MSTIFYMAPTCFGAISRHLRETETKISLKHKAVK